MGISSFDIKSMKNTVINGTFGTYIVGDSLGSGGNGTVFNVDIKNNEDIPYQGNGYVIKVLTYNTDDKKAQKRTERFIREIETVKNLKLPDLFIVPILDSYIDCKTGQDFKWYLMPKADKYNYFSLSSIAILKQMLKLGDSLYRLHNIEIMHRDIKPDNIMFFNGNCCLTDFGLVWTPSFSKLTDNNEAVGPANIRPPEMEFDSEILKVSIDYKKVDVYLFAKTLWIFLTKRHKGFKGRYNRSDKQIYLNRDKLELGTTIEPLHRLMENATKDENFDRIDLKDCLILIKQQIDIYYKKESKEAIKALHFSEMICEAKEQNVPDSEFYSAGDSIIAILEKLKGISSLSISDYPKHYYVGNFINYSQIKQNVFMITVSNNLCPINQTKQIYLNIKSIVIDKNKKVEMISDSMREEIRGAERLATFTDFIFSDKKYYFFDGKYTILVEPPVV